MNDRNKEQLIGEVISLTGLVLSIWLTKKMASNPDFGRTVRMKGALIVKRVADREISFWQEISAKSATFYQKARV